MVSHLQSQYWRGGDRQTSAAHGPGSLANLGSVTDPVQKLVCNPIREDIHQPLAFTHTHTGPCAYTYTHKRSMCTHIHTHIHARTSHKCAQRYQKMRLNRAHELRNLLVVFLSESCFAQCPLESRLGLRKCVQRTKSKTAAYKNDLCTEWRTLGAFFMALLGTS